MTVAVISTVAVLGIVVGTIFAPQPKTGTTTRDIELKLRDSSGLYYWLVLEDSPDDEVPFSPIRLDLYLNERSSVAAAPELRLGWVVEGRATEAHCRSGESAAVSQLEGTNIACFRIGRSELGRLARSAKLEMAIGDDSRELRWEDPQALTNAMIKLGVPAR